DVRRQAAFAPEVIPGVFEGRKDMLRGESKLLCNRSKKGRGAFFAYTVVGGFRCEQLRIRPQRLTIAAPEGVQRPARQLLARIPLALSEVQYALRRVVVFQLAYKLAGNAAFVRTERGRVPFRGIAPVDRHEGR